MCGCDLSRRSSVPNGGPATVKLFMDLWDRKNKLRFPLLLRTNPDFRVLMSISKCIVRLKDSHDTEHSVIVYAESLYEAAAWPSKVLKGKMRNS
jgi:hypothetical protein